ncbi:MAG: DUF2059 domain-containing protein, partial [Acinetobacter junii]
RKQCAVCAHTCIYLFSRWTSTLRGDDPLDLAVLELSQLLKETSSKLFARPETIQAIEKIYKDTLSEEEIQAYLKFLKTPEGKSINQKNLQISTNVFQYMNTLSQKTLSDPEQSIQLKEQFLSIIQPLIQQE